MILGSMVSLAGTLTSLDSLRHRDGPLLLSPTAASVFRVNEIGPAGARGAALGPECDRPQLAGVGRSIASKGGRQGPACRIHYGWRCESVETPRSRSP